jgi:hypothetical protein
MCAAQDDALRVEGSDRITAYRLSPDGGWTLEPAGMRREWMDATTGKFAYRCLPLSIANQAGWVVRCPGTFCATWNGKHTSGGVALRFTDGPEHFKKQVICSFGHGILSFLLPWIFRTPPGVQLLVRGAPNFWVSNAHPLEGVVETDWLSSTFSMNWQMTARNKEAWFRKGDPICMLTPMDVGALERFDPVRAELHDNPELAREIDEFRRKREETHRKSLASFEAGKAEQAYELDYIRGRTASGESAHAHRTKLKLREFGGSV